MRIVYLFVLILFTINNIYGQSAIKKSSEKVKIGENTYYAHAVQPKETLYSLSKAYNVTIEEILKHNESAVAGLKMGTILYIPLLQPQSNNSGDIQQSNAIAKQEEEPQKKERKNKKRDNAKADAKYKKHTVKWYEDITDISEKYNVTVESIMALNNLKTSKLKSRQTLLIPDDEYIKEGYITVAAEKILPIAPDTTQTTLTEKDSLFIEPEINQESTKVKRRNHNDPIEIAYILPLGSIDTSNINHNFMDFYAGSLLAVNDAKANGAPIKINLYDQSEYTPLHTLIDKPGFSANQILIGPARAKVLQTFAGYSQNSQTPLVSPLDNAAEELADKNPYFIQMPANAASQIENTIELLDKFRNQNSVSKILLINEKGNISDSLYVNSAKRLLDNRGIEYQTITYGILEGREIYNKMLASVDTLSPHQHIALVPSNSEAFVSDVLRNLDLCQKPGAKITLFGFPKWRNFETINVELYHKLNLHISLPYFVDYNNSNVKRFLLQYRALYATEPTPYAFQGYDITKYLLGQMEQFGNTFIHQQELEPASMLQSDFMLYRDSDQSGLKNRATRNIVYNQDYTVSVKE